MFGYLLRCDAIADVSHSKTTRISYFPVRVSPSVTPPIPPQHIIMAGIGSGCVGLRLTCKLLYGLINSDLIVCLVLLFMWVLFTSMSRECRVRLTCKDLLSGMRLHRYLTFRRCLPAGEKRCMSAVSCAYLSTVSGRSIIMVS